MNDLIYRQDAIDALDVNNRFADARCPEWYVDAIEQVPSTEPEQTKMIKEIREWINSGNRGSADYFIVDKIEEIINKYE